MWYEQKSNLAGEILSDVPRDKKSFEPYMRGCNVPTVCCRFLGFQPAHTVGSLCSRQDAPCMVTRSQQSFLSADPIPHTAAIVPQSTNF